MAISNDSASTTPNSKQHRKIHVHGCFYPHAQTFVPWLQIKGKYLQQAGFFIRDTVIVEIRHRQIVMTLVEE